jgi:hypothetical protein
MSPYLTRSRSTFLKVNSHTKTSQEQKLTGTTNTGCFGCISAIAGGKQRVTFKMACSALGCLSAESYSENTFGLPQNSATFGSGSK